MQKLVAAAVAILCLQCHAKCTNVEVPISGSVLRSDGTPIAGAVVVVSYIKYGVAESEVIYSSAAGRYSTTIHWDPISPAKATQEMYACDGKLSSVTIKAIARGFEAMRKVVELSDGSVNATLRLDWRRE
jgi:hypothetical protein